MDENHLLQKLAAGAAGSGMGVYLARVTGVDRVVSFLGGVVCCYLFTPIAVDYFNLAKYENPVSFVVGFLSMMFLKKVYEGLASIDTKEVVQVFVSKLRLWLGVK